MSTKKSVKGTVVVNALKGMTIGDVFAKANGVKSQAEADAFYEEYVRYMMTECSEHLNREQAERIVKSNLGYVAGYYDDATRARIEKLYHCSHPIFGSIEKNGAPSGEQAFAMGQQIGKKIKATKTPS